MGLSSLSGSSSVISSQYYCSSMGFWSLALHHPYFLASSFDDTKDKCGIFLLQNIFDLDHGHTLS